MIFTIVAGADEKCPLAKTLVFSNGMFNSYEDALESKKELKKHFEWDFESFEVAYNQNEKLFDQFFQIFEQKESSSKKFLWSYFSNLSGPVWFSNYLREKIKTINKKMYINDKDLRRHVELYKNLNLRENGVFVVAHSQGNFYANFTYDILVDLFKEDHGNQPFFRIISIANPDARFAGDKYGGYFTLTSDGVITDIPLSLPPNISNSNAGLFDHEFIRHYLRGDNSKDKILNFIRSSIIKDFPEEASDTPKEFLPMEKWISYTLKNPPKKLQMHECLAVSLYFEEMAWHKNCEKRAINKIRENAYECLKDEWSKDKDLDMYNCHLTGLSKVMNSLDGANQGSYFFLKKYENCLWKDNEVHLRISRSLIDQAVDFIENPHFRQK